MNKNESSKQKDLQKARELSEQKKIAENKSQAEKIGKDYKFGFNDGDIGVLKFEKGLSEQVVREISRIKEEPEWMLKFRLKSYQIFQDMPMPSFGIDLNAIDFNDFYYYLKPADHLATTWEDIPDKIKDTFNKLGIPEAEKNFLAGVATQYESEVVYSKIHQELEDKGVIFLDTDTGLKKYPELFKKYFGKLVPPGDNTLAALNSATWSGGSFIYVPKGVELEQPVQSYFRINSESMGQFERSLIIVDDGAKIHYIEGCTAPNYRADALHSGVIEIFVGKNADCRYTTIQNWSNNVYNLVTQRAIVDDGGSMEWVDGNLGSRATMKYPAVILKGKKSKGSVISIAVAGEGQVQDAGSRMIHIGENSSSSIISKSIARNGGNATYRGTVEHGPKAYGAKTNVECDTLILDEKSKSDTIPVNRIKNGASVLQHEAKVSKISEEQLFYLMSRGISEEKATEMIIMGFIEPFTRELPLEYAVELNQLIHLDMEGAQG